MKRIIASIVVAASIPIVFATPADALVRDHRCTWFAHRHFACFPLQPRPIVGTYTPAPPRTVPIPQPPAR